MYNIFLEMDPPTSTSQENKVAIVNGRMMHYKSKGAKQTFGMPSPDAATSAASSAAALSAGLPPTAITASTPAARARDRMAAISTGDAVSKWQWVS